MNVLNEFTKNFPDKEDYCYFIDLDAVLSQLHKFESLWSTRFSNLKLAYSYKSNNLSCVTRLMRAQGCCAEVVSLHELQLAINDGFSGEDIFFDGPVKSYEEIEFAVSNHINIQCDNIFELENIIDISVRTGIRPHVSFRISADYRGKGLSRFGMDKGEWHEALALLRCNNIELSGIHIHTGSNTTSADGVVNVFKAFEDEISSVHNTLSFIDIGGGYPSSTCGTDTVPILEQYPVAIAEQLNRLEIDTLKTTIILEPGRVLTEDYGYLITRIISVKNRFGLNLITAAASGTCVRSAQYGRQREVLIFPERNQDAEYSLADIHGSSCYENDILAAGVTIPLDLSLDDKIIICSCGAYDIMNCSDWIRKRPDVYVTFGGVITHERYRFAR